MLLVVIFIIAIIGLIIMVLSSLIISMLASWFLTSPQEISVGTISCSSQQSEDLSLSVIIVGAGAAGLFTGYTLEYCGIQNYQILEASSSYGGRVQELTDFLDVPLDLGAEWIHGDPVILQDLILFDNDNVDMDTISYQPQTYGVYSRGWQWRLNFLRFFYREFKFRTGTWFGYLRDYIVPYVESKLSLETVVETIDYSNNGDDGQQVRVTTRDGQVLLADKVVIAVPLAVMDDVEFIPELPTSIREAMNNVFVANGIKVWIEFSKDFYPDMQLLVSSLWNYLFSSDDTGEPLYFDAVFRKPSDRHALTYFLVGEKADTVTDLSDDEIIAKLLAELDDIFDGQATKHYIKHYIQNWAKVPFVRGAYSFDWDDFEETITELARPIDGKLYFAGEHTHVDEVSTVHGAALSGRRAAQAILRGD